MNGASVSVSSGWSELGEEAVVAVPVGPVGGVVDIGVLAGLLVAPRKPPLLQV